MVETPRRVLTVTSSPASSRNSRLQASSADSPNSKASPGKP
ncbi:hypothetical protein [Lactobacillus apis]